MAIAAGKYKSTEDKEWGTSRECNYDGTEDMENERSTRDEEIFSRGAETRTQYGIDKWQDADQDYEVDE